MRVVFMAGGAFAIPSLEALVAAGHEIAALVTQPDRASGRGLAVVSPRVKPVAERHGIPVLQLARVSAPEAQEALRRLAPELQVRCGEGRRDNARGQGHARRVLHADAGAGHLTQPLKHGRDGALPRLVEDPRPERGALAIGKRPDHRDRA